MTIQTICAVYVVKLISNCEEMTESYFDHCKNAFAMIYDNIPMPYVAYVI